MSSPIAAALKSGTFDERKNEAISIIDFLKERFFVDNIYYAGEIISSEQDYTDPDDAIGIDLNELKRSSLFILHYPNKKVSSVLVEAGWAISFSSPSIYFVKNKSDLPFLLRQVDISQYTASTKICVYSDLTDIENFLLAEMKGAFPMKEKKTPTGLAKPLGFPYLTSRIPMPICQSTSI